MRSISFFDDECEWRGPQAKLREINLAESEGFRSGPIQFSHLYTGRTQGAMSPLDYFKLYIFTN